MVRDEADVIAGTLAHMADEVDALYVADNRSIDGTRDLLAKAAADLPVPLTVLDDLDPAYYQADKMTALANRVAGEYDGDLWIVTFDADEIWYSPHGPIREVLADVRVNVCQAALYNHFRTSLDVKDPDPFRSMVWRTGEPAELGKVAFRWRPGARIEQGNHDVTLPHDLTHGLRSQVLELRHFPYRSGAQFITKAANGAEAYRLTDLPADMGAHWRAYGEMLERYGPDYLLGVFNQHFHHSSPIDMGMVEDPAPYRRWQQ
jgi:hypothetical protein